MSHSVDNFIRLLKDPFRSRLFLFFKLPSAFFAGVRIQSIDEHSCSVKVPYKWFSKNPFRSTYFACLSMAAEMSSGALAIAHTHQRKPAVSMLVVQMEGSFMKKATGITTFTCRDGGAIKQAVEEAVSSGEPRTVQVLSAGFNAAGEEVARFQFSWSFKQKTI